MASAGTVTIDFAAETSKFTNELKKVRGDLAVLKKDSASVNATLASFGNSVKGLIGFAAAATAIRAVVRETAEAEKAQALLNNALAAAGANVKAASAEFQAYATQLQKTTTFGDEAIIQVESLLLSFQGLSGETIKRATASVLDLSTRMGIDAPAAAKMLGKALADPEKGITALTRAGVGFSDSQKAIIKGLVDTGDAAGAQGLILKELEGRFGGAAAAARDTFGGALAGLQNAFGDLLEGKGGFNEAATSINALSDVLGSPEVQAAFAKAISLVAKLAEKGAQLATVYSEGWAGWKILLTGKGDNEQVNIDNMILKLEEERKTIEKTLRPQLSGGTRDLYAEENFTKDKARLAEINGQILALQVQWEEAGERARQARIYGDKPGQSFVTGGETPAGSSDGKLADDPQFEALKGYLQLTEQLNQSIGEQISAVNETVLAAQTELTLESANAAVDASQQRIEIAREEARNILAIQEELEQYTQELRASNIDHAVGLLGMLGQKHKAFAVASIVLEKAMAVRRILANNAVAAELAFASQLIPGFPPSLAAATAAKAAVLASGRISAAFTIAEGALQIGGVLGGGGGSSAIAAPNNRVFSDTADGGQPQGSNSQRVLQVIFNGPVYRTDDFRQSVVEAIREEVERDVVIISANSRNGQELREP